MTQFSNQTKNYLDSIKSTNERYKYATPQYIYLDLKRKGKLPQQFEENYGTPIQKEPTQKIEQTNLSGDNELGMVSSMFDLFIDEDSWDFTKAAYTRSLTGIAEQAYTGKKRYNVDEANFNFAEDLGATFLSFFMPLDALSLAFGGFLGKKMAQPLASKMLLKKQSDDVLKAISKKGAVPDDIVWKTLNKTENAIVGGVGGIPGLAIYEGAIGGHMAAIDGKDATGVLQDTVKGVLRGGALGFLTGAIGGGMGARSAEILSKSKKSGDPLTRGQWWKAKIGYGIPGQVGAESTLFTGAEYFDRIQGGEDIFKDGYWEAGKGFLKSWAHNVALFGALKTYGYGKEKALSTYRKSPTGKAVQDTLDVIRNEVLRASKAEKDSVEKMSKNINDTLESENINVPESIQEKISKKESADPKTSQVVGLIDIIKDGIKKIDKLVDKDKPETLESNAEKISEVYNTIKLAERLLEQAEGGSIEGIQIQIKDNVKEQISKEKEKLTKMVGEMQDSFSQNASNEANNKSNNLNTNIDQSSSTNKVSKVEELVTKIAVKEGKTNEQVMNDKSYHVINPQNNKPLLDVSGRPRLDTNKLQNRLDTLVKQQPDSPSGNLEKAKLELDFGKVEQSSPHLNQKIQKEKKTALEYIKDLGLSKENYENLILGIAEFFPSADAKSLATNPKGRGHANTKGASVKMLADFVKWLDSKNIKLTEITDASTAQLYISEVKPNWNTTRRNTFGDALAVFFGSGGLGGKQKGFADKYMGKDAYDNPIVRPKRETGKQAGLGKVGVATPKTFETIKNKISSLFGKGDLKGDGKQKVEPTMFDAIVDTFYNFGARGVDTLRRLKIENIDWKNGIIREWSTGLGQKGGESRIDLPVKEILPELWAKMEKAKGERDSGSLFVDTAGKEITQSSFNKILKQVTEGKDIKLRGDKEYITLQDFRRMIETDAAKISPEVSNFVDRILVGHKQKGQKETYNILEIKKLWKEFTENRGKLEYDIDSPLTENIKLQISKERDGLKKNLSISEERQQSQKQYFETIPSYSKLKIQLRKNLGKKDGDKILGKIEGHLIEILEGRSREDTIPHEISHYVVDVLKSFGTSKDKQLINRGMKLFAKDVKRKKGETTEQYNARVEEAFVQRLGEATLAQMKMKELGLKERTMKDVKGFKGKLKYFAKQFNDRLKQMFGLTSKGDVAYMMSRKIFTGEGVPSGRQIYNHIEYLKTRHQTDSEKSSSTKKALNGQAQGFERILEKEYGVDRETLDSIREMHGITAKGGGGKVDAYSTTKIEAWVSKLESKLKELDKVEGKKEKKIKTDEINEAALEYNVLADDIAGIAKSFGRADGDYTKLPPKLKEHLLHIIKTHGEKTEEIDTTFKNLEQMAENMPVVSFFARKVGVPVFHILRTKGGKPGNIIANKILQFDVTLNSEFKGPGMIVANEIKKLLSRKEQDNIWMFDAEMVSKYRKDVENGIAPPLSKSQEKFLELIKLGKVNETSGEFEGTPQYKAFNLHKQLMSFYWNAIATEAKVINNKAEYEKFKKEFSEKFVNNFFHRRLTKKALNYILTAKDGKYLGKELDLAIERESARKALKHDPTKGIKYQERLKELRDKNNEKHGLPLYEKAIENLNWIITHQYHKVKASFLESRGPLLDSYIDISGPKQSPKFVRTYETTLQNTVEPYIMAVSKYLATLRHFPEYTGLGGKYKLGKTGIDIAEMRFEGGKNNLAEYTHDAIKKMLDIPEVDRGAWAVEKNAAFSGLRNFANFSAAIGLSSPTSGIKNLLIGMPRTYATFGGYNTFRGMVKLLNHDTWKDAESRGVLAFASKTMELGQITAPGSDKPLLKYASMENLFNFNLMTLTENMNRIVASEAGKLYFMSKLDAIQGVKGGIFGGISRKEAERYMRDVYKLGEKEIQFLKEGDFGGKANADKFQKILMHVQHYSHVSTQGGTSVGQLPLWMSSRGGKPLTLFQRMAYSTTFDTVQNYVKPALKFQNFAPLARAIFGHSIGGAALGGMYMWLFDKESPASSEDLLGKAVHNLWRSEFAGLFGVLYDPYLNDDRGVISNLMTPVIYRNILTSRDALASAFDGRGFAEASKDWLDQTIVLVGQYNKMRKNEASPEWSNARKWNTRMIQFMDDYGLENNNTKYQTNFYYKNLKENIYWGSEEDIAKTFFAAYAEKVTQLEKVPGTTPLGRHREALKAIKNSVESMNPLSISEYTNNNRIISKRDVYLDWVRRKYGNKGYDEAIKAERQYKFLLRKYYKVINNKKYWKKYGAYGYDLGK